MLKYLSLIGLCAMLLVLAISHQIYWSLYRGVSVPSIEAPALFAASEVSQPLDPVWIVKNDFELKDNPDVVFTHNTFTTIPACDFDADGKLIENSKCRYRLP